MTVTTRLDESIDDYSTDGREAFIKARTALAGARTELTRIKALTPPADEKAIKEQEATVKKAQEELSSALSQTSSAARLQGEQTDRAGFAAVVQLMQATAAATEAICTKIVSLAHADGQDSSPPDDTDLDSINALTLALRALAELSPTAVWTKEGRPPGG